MTSKARNKFELTDFKIRAIVPPAFGSEMYHDTNVPAFALRVSAGGARTWAGQRGGGKKGRQTLRPVRGQCRFKIGRYPPTTRANAREAGRRPFAEIDKGTSPTP